MIYFRHRPSYRIALTIYLYIQKPFDQPEVHVNDSIAEELFQHTPLKLQCNVHLLDGRSNKIKSTLKVYDNDNGIQSCTFGCYIWTNQNAI